MNSAVEKHGVKTALIGIGSNLAGPLRQVADAVEALSRLGDDIALSGVFRTSPVGYAPQPDFLNLVAQVRTDFSPEMLLGSLQEIELRAGRERRIPNGPRPIDIDLLDYAGLVMGDPDLTLPHPRMHERRFVLEPLIEISPGWWHPVLQRTARELLDSLPEGERVLRLGDLTTLLAASTTGAYSNERDDQFDG